MYGERCRKPVEALERVAVEHRDVMVSGLDHDEQIERIGFEHRLLDAGA